MASERAEAFNEWARKGAGAKMEEAHAFAGKKVLDRIALGYDESFIDVGCGNGWATRYMAERVPTIGLCVGVDPSEEFIKEARRLSAGRLPIKFLAAPIEDVPFGESSFNQAFSMEALYYVRDPLDALKAVLRLLKRGGWFHLVVDFYKENVASAAWQDDIRVKMHFLSQDEWVELFRRAGFSEVAAERVLDDRHVPEGFSLPWGGFNTRDELLRFRTEVGSLYVRGKKGDLSHALDPYLEKARDAMRKGESPAAEPASEKAPKKRKRFGLL